MVPVVIGEAAPYGVEHRGPCGRVGTGARVRPREDADLVELLAAVDVDSPIPLEAFAAVAEILAYLYQAQVSWPEADH